jgi:hypothetical protein
MKMYPQFMVDVYVGGGGGSGGSHVLDEMRIGQGVKGSSLTIFLRGLRKTANYLRICLLVEIRPHYHQKEAGLADYSIFGTYFKVLRSRDYKFSAPHSNSSFTCAFQTLTRNEYLLVNISIVMTYITLYLP